VNAPASAGRLAYASTEQIRGRPAVSGLEEPLARHRGIDDTGFAHPFDGSVQRVARMRPVLPASAMTR